MASRSSTMNQRLPKSLFFITLHYCIYLCAHYKCEAFSSSYTAYNQPDLRTSQQRHTHQHHTSAAIVSSTSFRRQQLQPWPIQSNDRLNRNCIQRQRSYRVCSLHSTLSGEDVVAVSTSLESVRRVDDGLLSNAWIIQWR